MQRKESGNMIILIGILLLVGFASLMFGGDYIRLGDMMHWLIYRDGASSADETLNALILSLIHISEPTRPY